MKTKPFSTVKTRFLQSIKAGIIYGLGMSIFFLIIFPALVALLTGLFSGVLFTVFVFIAIYFLSSQTSMDSKELLEGETVINWMDASLLVDRKTYGLRKYFFDKFSWILGMKGKESIGGKLFITNYRLIFRTHKTNRLVGDLNISMGTISEVSNSSYFILKKITIKCEDTKINVGVFEPERAAEVINQQVKIAGMNSELIHFFVNKHPEKFNDNLKLSKTLHVVDEVLHGKETLIDKWQKKFDK